MSSELIRNLMGSFAEEEEPAPLQMFLQWWSENPEAAPEDWERVAGAVDAEVEVSHQTLQQLLREVPDASPFREGLTALEEMRAQRGWPQTERQHGDWANWARTLEQEAATWAGWSEQSLCPACGAVNSMDWSSCRECGQALTVDEPVGDWKEVAPGGPLPPDVQRLLQLIAGWRANGQESAVVEHLGGMRARYQAATRQLRGMPELLEQFEQAGQVVTDMAALPLHWDQLDRGYRLLCGHLAEANRLIAGLKS
ncbi:MAG: zinc ribbon domain-containing protein [Candidatus Eremiobacteraeota bacterium]|nr:zinc ribbon domain-containing protein [Candidatus Eremiobacteraeota bacterium]